jgi:hypothetical protein
MISIKSDILRDKIMQIRTAIVHCPEDHFFQQQAVIGRTLELDEKGELWLSVDKPVNCADNGDGCFDVVLNYQKKGLPFDLDILGEARLIDGADEIKNLSARKKAELKKGKIILRIHIIDVDYWQHKKPVFKTMAKKIKDIFSHTGTNEKQEAYSNHSVSA